MRTKTLLIAAAALVAGVISSNAQVYSANIVGYCQVGLTNGLTLVSNPLDNGTNDLNSLFPTAGFFDTVYQFNGSGFNISTYTGTWSPDLIVPPGSGVFYSGGANQTTTFTGQFAVSNLSKSINAGLNIVGSQIPESATLENLNFPTSFFDTAYFYRNGGYVISTYTGTWGPDLTLGVGEAFWINAGSSETWTQNFSE
jgi:hypothetical protein